MPLDDNQLDQFAAELEQLADWEEAAGAERPRINPRLVATLIRVLRQAVILQVVASVAELPVEAGPRRWYRVQGDSNIYIGNGAGNALRKLPTQPI